MHRSDPRPHLPRRRRTAVWIRRASSLAAAGLAGGLLLHAAAVGVVGTVGVVGAIGGDAPIDAASFVAAETQTSTSERASATSAGIAAGAGTGTHTGAGAGAGAGTGASADAGAETGGGDDVVGASLSIASDAPTQSERFARFEQPESGVVRAWVARERALSARMFAAMPARAWFHARFAALATRAAYASPERQGRYLVSSSLDADGHTTIALDTAPHAANPRFQVTDNADGAVRALQAAPDGWLVAYARAASSTAATVATVIAASAPVPAASAATSTAAATGTRPAIGTAIGTAIGPASAPAVKAPAPDAGGAAMSARGAASSAQIWRIHDLRSGRDLPDRIVDARAGGTVVWSADSRSLFYVRVRDGQPDAIARHDFRLDSPVDLPAGAPHASPESAAPVEFGSGHAIGTADDVVIFTHPSTPRLALALARADEADADGDANANANTNIGADTDVSAIPRGGADSGVTAHAGAGAAGVRVRGGANATSVLDTGFVVLGSTDGGRFGWAWDVRLTRLTPLTQPASAGTGTGTGAGTAENGVRLIASVPGAHLTFVARAAAIAGGADAGAPVDADADIDARARAGAAADAAADADRRGFLFLTDHDVPRGRLVLIEPGAPAADVPTKPQQQLQQQSPPPSKSQPPLQPHARPEPRPELPSQPQRPTPQVEAAAVAPARWRTLIAPARPGETLEQVVRIGRRYAARWLLSDRRVVRLHAIDGRIERELPLPGPGTVSALSAGSANELFFQFSSYVTPPGLYRYDIARRALQRLRAPDVPFDSDAYETSALTLHLPAGGAARVSPAVASAGVDDGDDGPVSGSMGPPRDMARGIAHDIAGNLANERADDGWNDGALQAGALDSDAAAGVAMPRADRQAANGVTLSMTARRGRARDVEAPLLLYVNGFRGPPATPAFAFTVAGWLDAGGRFAVLTLPPPGERAHEADVAEICGVLAALAREGLARPARLVVHGGGAHGGLLVATALLREPALAAASWTASGPLDLLALERQVPVPAWAGEYGDRSSADGRARRASLSPLEAIGAAAPRVPDSAAVGDSAWPSHLLTIEDPAVPAWHSYKFVAALNESRGGVRAALLREEPPARDTAAAHARMLDERADVYAFFAARIAMTPPAPRAAAARRPAARGAAATSRAAASGGAAAAEGDQATVSADVVTSGGRLPSCTMAPAG